MKMLDTLDARTTHLSLSGKGQSSPAQTYDAMDIMYEEIGLPHPVQGNYEYSQCQAYAIRLVGDEIDVVETHGEPVHIENIAIYQN